MVVASVKFIQLRLVWELVVRFIAVDSPETKQKVLLPAVSTLSLLRSPVEYFRQYDAII